MIDYSKFVENSRKWLYDYIKDNHLQSVVIGISAGIDSTVSACLASSVCKELSIPLIGRSLPTSTNSPTELNIARLVGGAFCDDFKEISIYKMFQPVTWFLNEQEGIGTALQQGNIKARLRMIYLYDVASKHKGVVLDNDNFTEYNTGFFTIHGDQGDINLGLHYLWKTEIYELASYLKDIYFKADSSFAESNPIGKYNALNLSMKLTPTDGNGVSESDCEQFGLDNYEQVDDVLKTMYYPHQLGDKRFEEWNDDKAYIRLIDSYNEQGVDRVMILHQNTKYKRKPSPIMPKREELI